MAGAGKKSKKAPKPHSDDEQGSEEEPYSGPQEIQATFEGRNLEGGDFHGIKQLLQQLFPTEQIDLSQLTDLLIAQAGIGSVLKQSCNDSDDEEDLDMVEESDVFGITSVVNLTSHRETPCVQQLFDLIENQCTNQQFKDTLAKSKKLGLIINERFVNIPSKIAPVMLTSIRDEVQRMSKKNADYQFDYFLMFCKMWRSKGTLGECQYSNDEEELILKQSDCTFEYSSGKTDTGLVGNWASEDKQLISYRTVCVFQANKFSHIVDQIAHFVDS